MGSGRQHRSDANRIQTGALESSKSNLNDFRRTHFSANPQRAARQQNDAGLVDPHPASCRAAPQLSGFCCGRRFRSTCRCPGSCRQRLRRHRKPLFRVRLRLGLVIGGQERCTLGLRLGPRERPPLAHTPPTLRPHFVGGSTSTLRAVVVCRRPSCGGRTACSLACGLCVAGRTLRRGRVRLASLPLQAGAVRGGQPMGRRQQPPHKGHARS